MFSFSKLLNYTALIIFGILSCETTVQGQTLAGETLEGPNLIQNGSFEEVADDSSLKPWSYDSSVFSLEEGTASDGNRAIHYKNDNPEIYSLIHQDVPCEPKKRYYVSGRVKINHIENGNPNICLQWSDGNGTWLGGSYFSLVPEDVENGWGRIAGHSDPIPENASRVSLSCYLERQATGDVLFDQIDVRLCYPPLLTGITTDRYRQIVEGGDLDVAVLTCCTGDEIEQFSDTKLIVSGEKLSQPLTYSPSRMDRDQWHFTVPTDSLEPGSYVLTFSTVRKQNGKEETITGKMTRIDPKTATPMKARIDEHQRLILDGKPFFPLGLYMGDVSPDDLATIALSPFNCLMPYHMISREQLDAIHEKNIKVFYSVKDLYIGNYGLNSDQEALEKIRSVVEPLKDHPAIAVWYINDELHLTRLNELVSHRNLMEEIDPSRPTWVTLFQVNDIARYLNTFDIVGTDPYPVPTKPVSLAWEWSQKTNRGTGYNRAVWQVPQIFDWTVYKVSVNEKKEENRAPTFEEMRGMIWMNIAGGANGIVCYSFYDLKKMDQQPGSSDNAPAIRKPFDQSWLEVTTIAREVSDNTDILLSIETPLNLTTSDAADTTSDQSPTEQERVGWRLYGKDGVTWLLAVNLTEEPVTFSWQSENPLESAETRIGTSEQIAVTGKTITVTLGPYEPILTGVRPAASAETIQK